MAKDERAVGAWSPPNPATITLTVDVGDTILNRVDVVCLRIDKNQSVQEVVIKKGALAASPVYPAPVRDMNYDEIFLAALSVPAGTTELTAALLTDLRLNEEYCGLMRDGVTGIPTAQLQAQAEALIASLQEVIDGVIDGSQYMLKTAYDDTNEVSGAGGIVPYVDSALATTALIANRIYPGVDLSVAFAAEIAEYANVWAWVKARIQAANFAGLHVGDYIPFVAGGNTLVAEIGRAGYLF